MGKNKYIETPEKMWEYFLSYKEKVKGNPVLVSEQKKGNMVIPKDFKGEKLPSAIIELPKERPLTMEGFENWLCDQDIITDVSDYFENKGGAYSNYVPICARIRRNIRQDQIEGGMTGIYHPSITQRLNNLKEQTETEVKKTVYKVGYKKPNDDE